MNLHGNIISNGIYSKFKIYNCVCEQDDDTVEEHVQQWKGHYNVYRRNHYPLNKNV